MAYGSIVKPFGFEQAIAINIITNIANAVAFIVTGHIELEPASITNAIIATRITPARSTMPKHDSWFKLEEETNFHPPFDPFSDAHLYFKT